MTYCTEQQHSKLAAPAVNVVYCMQDLPSPLQVISHIIHITSLL